MTCSYSIDNATLSLANLIIIDGTILLNVPPGPGSQ